MLIADMTLAEESSSPPSAAPPELIRRTPGRRILYLTRDFELIRRQLEGSLSLSFDDLSPGELLDDINTDTMSPAWVCFHHLPEDIAREAYAGLVDSAGRRVFARNGLIDGGFEIIVSGQRKGVGSSRETAVQAEKFAGIRIAIADSFAPIHARNNINQGVLMAGYEVLQRLEAGDAVELEAFLHGLDPLTREVVRHGGLFAFSRALAGGEAAPPPPRRELRPMTMAEKILARHAVRGGESASGEPASSGEACAAGVSVAAGDSLVVTVDCGYSHDFTSAQVHTFLRQEHGESYSVQRPDRFAAFEDHLVYADEVPRLRPHLPKVETLRQLQRDLVEHTGVRAYLADEGVSPGICHEVARQELVAPGDFVQATDSHTCMGGANNALAWGVGVTEYSNLLWSGTTPVEVPECIRFHLVGELAAGVTAKDLMLFLLLRFAKTEQTLNRVMEFTGPGLRSLSMDERATLANMATECSARGAVVEADEATFRWLAERRCADEAVAFRQRAVAPDPGALYLGGEHIVDLSSLRPMVAHPGDPGRGEPSDPTNGAWIDEIGEVAIDIAYGGSCTAGKVDDLAFYHQVCLEALAADRRVPEEVQFLIQFGSREVEAHARREAWIETFEQVGVRLIQPGCGACIGCGPGVSERAEQVTVSAINRNYQGRSGPGRLYLASPLTVAASAFAGRIVAYEVGMFRAAVLSS
ncbi:MAG: aconitase family protein [Acidobacteriota bacterium]